MPIVGLDHWNVSISFHQPYRAYNKNYSVFCSYCFVWEAMRTKIYTYTLHFLWCINKVAIQQVDTFLLYHEHQFNKLGTISIYLIEI